jgi:TonB-linked SusC/RagA family outer membrane protein
VTLAAELAVPSTDAVTYMRLSTRGFPGGPGQALLVLASFLFSPPAAPAQDATIAGRVTGTDQAPVSGAIVSVGTRFTATTSPAGSYTLTIPATVLTGGTVQLMVRRIGFRPASRVVPLEPGSRQEDFVLEPDPLRLEEVVVTGVSDAMSTRKLPFSVGVVRAEEMQAVPGVTALEALAGRVAGVNMMQGVGVPGRPPAIRIRGYTSIYAIPQPPLIIIDGTITRMTLADVSAEDIERLEVLKGAAATSYYGSDAANGVIQIFTRRGTSQPDGKLTAIARFEGGASFVTQRPRLSRHHNYQLDGNGDFLRAPDGTRIAEPDLVMDNVYPVYYDHYGMVLQAGQFYTGSLSLSQRKGNTSIYASFQHTGNEGQYVMKDGFARQNYRLNLDQALLPEVDLSLNMFYGRSRSDGQEMAAAWGNWDLLSLEPHQDILAPNADGTPYNNQLPDAGNLGVWNPLYDMRMSTSTDDRQRFTGGGRLRWRPAAWLSLEGQFSYDAEGSQRFDEQKHGYINYNGDVWDGWMTRSWFSGRNYNTGVTATGAWSWRKVRNTSRLAFVYEDQLRTELSGDGGRYILGGITSFAGTDPAANKASSARYAIRTQDLYGVTTFDIADRYIFDALVRRDASSLFGAESRHSTYFRLSGAWRVTEDIRIPGVEELRLRSSYGTAGLRPGFDYQYELLYPEGGAFVKRSLGNPLLRPAHSGEFEVGTNVILAGGYFSLEYNYSRKETRDQMVRQNLPAVSGFTTQWVNAGTLLTRTHELALGLQPIRRPDLSLTLNLTADRMRSVITEWPLPDQREWFGWYRAGQDQGIFAGIRFAHSVRELYDDPVKKAQSGRGQYWSPDSVLVNELGHVVRRSAWRTPGEKPIIYATCADPPECTQSDQIVDLGRLDPDFTLNLSATFSWKRFALNGLVYWWQGGQIYNWETAEAVRYSRSALQDQSGRPPAERKPETYFTDIGRVDEPLLEPGTFVKIRELSVSYTFLRRELQRVGLGLLNEARIGLAGRNLFTFTAFTGWDPEVGTMGTAFIPGQGYRPARSDPFRIRGQSSATYPIPRTVTATVELAF